MSNPMQGELAQGELFSIAGYPAQSKDQTLSAKQNISLIDSQEQKSSKILAQDSTTKEKDLKPYWNDVCEAISSKLWLPTEIDFAGSDLSSSNLLLNKPVEKSWFSTIKIATQKQSSQKTCYPSSTLHVAGCTENAVIAKSKKIRIYPTLEQRALLKHWFGTSRYVFNKTVEYLKQPGTKARWMKVAPIIKSELPEWADPVPCQIKQIAVRDACFAVRDAKKKTIKGEHSFVKFRSRRDRVQSVFIPSTAIKPKGVYHTILGELRLSQELPEKIRDSRLILHRGQYFLCVSTETSVVATENQSGNICALDPGVRTFLSFYSPRCAGKIGDKDFGRIHRLCFYLDQLVSRISKAKARQKRRLKKAADRLRTKIYNLINEIHHQAANWLTKNFGIILLPTFETSQMASRSNSRKGAKAQRDAIKLNSGKSTAGFTIRVHPRSSAVRKLRSKTVRAMLTWAHYRFQEFLLDKAKERNKQVLLVNEAYTSKTVNWTGEVDGNLGGKKKIKSKLTNTWMDRDINGALGILLRALVDTPSLESIRSAFVN